MYAPDGRTISVSVYEVENWKSVGWYDYPQAVVYVGEVEKWKAVAWYDQPVSLAKSRTNSSGISFYPNTTIPSYDSYGRYGYQNFSDDGETIYWGYYTSLKDANKYLSVLYDSGFDMVFSENLEFIDYASLYKCSSDELVYILYDHRDNTILIGYNI